MNLNTTISLPLVVGKANQQTNKQTNKQSKQKTKRIMAREFPEIFEVLGIMSEARKDMVGEKRER